MSDLISAVGRLGRVMGFMSHKPEDIVNEAIRRELNRGGDVSPLPEAKRVAGRIIGPALNIDGNERAIARVERTRVIRKGEKYTSRGRTTVARKELRKRTAGYRVQFRYRGKLHCKFFSDSKHNGALGARAAARKWRDATERAIGRSVVVQKVCVRIFEEQSR